MDRRHLLQLASVNYLLLMSNAAFGQSNYPIRTIRWIVPSAAGGPLDSIARKIAAVVARNIGQQIIIENRTGASGSVGATEVVRSEPDGYTFLFSQAESLINAAALIKALPYNPKTDFEFVTQTVTTQVVVIANADVPGNGLSDVLQIARDDKRDLSYGSWGPGTLPHILFETLRQRSNASLIHVPYRGGAPAMQDLVAKQISLTVAPPIVAKQLAEQGQIKMLAVTGSSSLPLLPNVPTFAALNYQNPVFGISVWHGLSAPKGTTRAVIDFMYSAVTNALKNDELTKYFNANAYNIVANRPEQFRASFDREFDLVTQMIKDAGVLAE